MMASAALRLHGRRAETALRQSHLKLRFSTYANLKPVVKALPEVVSASSFPERLDAKLQQGNPLLAEDAATLQGSSDLVRTALTAAMATTSLHTQSRIAAYGGYGYYTIGPCGEELMAALGLAMRLAGAGVRGNGSGQAGMARW